MRNVLSLILPLLIFIQGYSQKKIFTYADEKNISSYPFPRSSAILMEPNNAFIYTQAEKDRISRFLWSNNNTTKLVEQRSSTAFLNDGFRKYSIVDEKLVRMYWRNPVVGGLYKNRQIIEIIRDKKKGDFYFLKTDLQSGVTEFTDSIQTSFSEKIIYCLTKPDRLYLFTTRTNSDELVIYTKTIDGTLTKNVRTITFRDLGIKATDETIKGNHFSDIFIKDEFAVYENNQRYPAVVNSFSSKIYCLTDKVVFMMNTDSNVCTLVFDLKDLGYTIKKFSRISDSTIAIKPSATSSHIFNDKLVSCDLINETLLLNIFDFHSGERIKSIKINKDNVEGMAVESVQKTGSFLSKSDVKSEGFNKFIGTAKNNSLWISCYEENQNIYISLAAPYKQIINGSTLFNIAATAAGTYGINALPNRWGYLVYAYKGAQTSTYVGFDVSLNSSSFSPTKQAANYSVWDQLVGFVDTHPEHGNDRLFFYMNGTFYLSDYLPYTNTYSIYSFDQNGVN